MTTKTDIILIEIQQSKKILQNEIQAKERIMITITESENLIKQKDLQISKMRKTLDWLDKMHDRGDYLIPHSIFEEIKQHLK